MRYVKTFVLALLLVGFTTMAYAELQNVEVGGSIRIRGNWYDLGNGEHAFLFGEHAFVEQRTRLNVKADFTDEVSAFIEIDDWSEWGTGFRSNALYGIDFPDGGDVHLYQAYIQADKMWGTDLRLRVGRQEIKFGSQWLVGVNDTSSLFYGLSFDALRLTYATDTFSVDAVAAKLAETNDSFSNGDTDLYAVYGSYTGIEDITLDAYWMYVKDDNNLVGDPHDVNLHTVGLRGAGKAGAFDFEAELAYQFGEIEINGLPWWHPDVNLDYNAWGANAEAGYTFDMDWQPRVFLGGAFLEGADQNTKLIRHFENNDLGFNRLFSNWEYSEFLDATDLSNVWLVRGGVSVQPTEKIKLTLAAAYYETDKPREYRFLFWTWENDAELGWEVGLYGTYHYSEDLVFRAGYAHFFGQDGLSGGNRIVGNGLLPYDDPAEDDYDYLFVETELSF
jgi:hypothetical protein